MSHRPIMNFHNQRRICHAEPFAALRVNSAKHLRPSRETLSAAKDDNILPILFVKIQNRRCANGVCEAVRLRKT